MTVVAECIRESEALLLSTFEGVQVGRVPLDFMTLINDPLVPILDFQMQVVQGHELASGIVKDDVVQGPIHVIVRKHLHIECLNYEL